MRRSEILVGGAAVGTFVWNFHKDRTARGGTWRHRPWHRADGGGRRHAGLGCDSRFMARGDGSLATCAAPTSGAAGRHPRRVRPCGACSRPVHHATGSRHGHAGCCPRAVTRSMPRRLATKATGWSSTGTRWQSLGTPCRPASDLSLGADVGPAATARAHVDAWHPSSCSEAAMAGVQATRPYRHDLQPLAREVPHAWPELSSLLE